MLPLMRTCIVLLLLLGVPLSVAARPTVLELYTSQGCSSCPPAEAALNELAQGADVLALSLHVDYWNSLGWIDPWSSSLNTARQQAYARVLDSAVYTPQLVIDGAYEAVGSDRRAVGKAIARSRVEALDVSINATRSGDRLDYRVAAFPASSATTLLLLSYVPQTRNDVRAGENAGRQLQGRNVVTTLRTLATLDGHASAAASVVLDGIERTQPLALLLQQADGRIIGATSLP